MYCRITDPFFPLQTARKNCAHILELGVVTTFFLHALKRKGISIQNLLQILYTSSLKPLACCDGTNETTNLSVNS
jgi:hypothetical protein